MLAWTHLCRIYRTGMTQYHDLSRVKSSSDIYEEDKWCRVLPSDAEIFELTPGGAATVGVYPVDIWFPRGLAVSVGDVVEVKKTRVISGTREAVAGKLLDAASTGDTTIYIDTPIGFESGDEITITDGTNSQRVVVKSVDDSTVVLFDALSHDFAVDTDVEADTFYKIQSIKVPGSVGPIIQTTAMVTFLTSQDD